MAEKPPNLDEMSEAWADPQRWMMEVAVANDYWAMVGDEPAPVDIGPQHSRQMQDYNLRKAGKIPPYRGPYHSQHR